MRPDLDLRAHLSALGARLVLAATLAVIVLAAVVAGVAQPLLLSDGSADLSLSLYITALPLTVALPVIAVTMLAGPFSDRSVQQTLLQRPDRRAVLGSTVLAVLALAAVLFAVTLGLAALATWLGGTLLGTGPVIDGYGRALLVQSAMLLATTVFSVAVALLLRSTVLALVVALGVPVVVSAAGGIAAALGRDALVTVVRAVDLQAAASSLAFGEASPIHLLPLLLLVVLPAALGVRGWMRTEVA